MIVEAWELNQQNLITFVMVDSTNTEVTGLGATFTLLISKAGGAFAAGLGTKNEIAGGWYKYLATAAEADTIGPISIRATGAGTVQQNLEYVVGRRTVNSIEWPYIITSSVTGLPVSGIEVWFTTDVAGNNIVWTGTTDTFGSARDDDGDRPWLDPGTYQVWVQGPGFTADEFPDEEVVA